MIFYVILGILLSAWQHADFVFFPIFYAQIIMAKLQFNTVKDYVVYKIINKERNADFLANVPHVTYLDLAITFYYVIPETAEGPNKKAVLIQKEDIDNWNVGVADLMEAASENTPKLMGLKIQGILSTIAEYLDDDSAIDFVGTEDNNLPIYVATNKGSVYGAAVILYKDMLKALSAKFKSDLYIIPCSIHEVIVLKAIKDCQIDTLSLKELIAQVNETEVPEGEILSDSLYYYSKESNVLSIA